MTVRWAATFALLAAFLGLAQTAVLVSLSEPGHPHPAIILTMGQLGWGLVGYLHFRRP